MERNNLSKNPVYSHSALSTFETCPRQYKHLYLLRDVKHLKTKENERGDLVHKAIAAWIEHGTESAEYAAEINVVRPLVTALRARAPAYEEFAELKWGLTPGFTPTGFFDSNVYLRGVIDYVLIEPTSAFVLDHKTGKKKEDFAQLDTFATAVFCLNPSVERVRAAFGWLKTGEFTHKDYTREGLRALTRAIEAKIETVWEHTSFDNFPGRPSGLCRGWCPVRQCEHWSAQR